MPRHLRTFSSGWTVAAWLLLISPLAASAQNAATERGVSHELLRIPAAGPAATVVFGRISAVRFGADGSLYVLDTADNTIKSFDPAGRPLRQFGAKGHGTGQFERPSVMRVTSDRVFVFDHVLEKVTWFTTDGQFQGQRRVPRLSQWHTTLRATGVAGGRLLLEQAPILNAPGPEFRNEFRLQLLTMSDHHALPIRSYPTGLTVAHHDNQRLPVAGQFGAGGVWAMSGDTLVAVVDAYSGRIEYFDLSGSEPALRNTRELRWTPSPVRPDPVEDAALRERNAPRMNARSGELRVDYPRFSARAAEALFASNGDLWIRIANAQAAQTVQTWLLVPRSSGPGGTFNFPAGFRLHAVHGQRLAGILTTAAGESSVRVYQLPR